MTEPRYLVVSFHDLYPRTAAACERFIDRMSELGVPRLSLMVVPRWHGGPTVDRDDGFVSTLRAWQSAGHEIVLHGCTHMDRHRRPRNHRERFLTQRYTDEEGEFYGLEMETALARLRQGKAVLERRGFHPEGFVAPAWLMSSDAEEAARRLGLLYAVRFGRLALLQQGATFRAPVLVCSVRSAWRRTVSRWWIRFFGRQVRRARVLRIAAHPDDLKYPAVENALYRIVACHRREREALTYAELARRLSGSEDPP
jgi:predicted deacetylase